MNIHKHVVTTTVKKCIMFCLFTVIKLKHGRLLKKLHFFSYLKLCFVFETGIQVAPALAVCVFSFSIHGPARRWEIMNNKGERVHKKTTDQTALQVSSNKRFRSAPFGFIFYGVSASSQPNHTLLSQKKELLHITTVIYHYGDKK